MIFIKEQNSIQNLVNSESSIRKEEVKVVPLTIGNNFDQPSESTSNDLTSSPSP
jgi:hypothetical protein